MISFDRWRRRMQLSRFDWPWLVFGQFVICLLDLFPVKPFLGDNCSLPLSFPRSLFPSLFVPIDHFDSCSSNPFDLAFNLFRSSVDRSLCVMISFNRWRGRMQLSRFDWPWFVFGQFESFQSSHFILIYLKFPSFCLIWQESISKNRIRSVWSVMMVMDKAIDKVVFNFHFGLISAWWLTWSVSRSTDKALDAHWSASSLDRFQWRHFLATTNPFLCLPSLFGAR
jgi:hypothetical protein